MTGKTLCLHLSLTFQCRWAHYVWLILRASVLLSNWSRESARVSICEAASARDRNAAFLLGYRSVHTLVVLLQPPPPPDHSLPGRAWPTGGLSFLSHSLNQATILFVIRSNIIVFLGNRNKKGIKVVHTPRRSTPTQEHLGLFLDCFGAHLYIFNFKV